MAGGVLVSDGQTKSLGGASLEFPSRPDEHLFNFDRGGTSDRAAGGLWLIQQKLLHAHGKHAGCDEHLGDYDLVKLNRVGFGDESKFGS